MKLTIMVEGQEGVTWPDWLALARAAEDLGFEGLLRSDHYVSLMGPQDRGALDAWGTVNALAAVTERIRLGTLVSPVTFRPAAVLAKLALTADHVSGGRIDVGMGTGWNQREHDTYGFPFPPMKERFDELVRQVDEVTRFWTDLPPAPVDPARLRLVLGGGAQQRAAALAARHANEYNLVYPTVDDVRGARERLTAACEEIGRDPASLRLSAMLAFVVGEDRAAVHRRAEAVMAAQGAEGTADAWVQERLEERSWLIGTPDEVVGRLREYGEAGLERVALQHLDHRDLDVLGLVARDVMPAVA